MKIENNALNPLAPKKSEGLYQIERNQNTNDIHKTVAGKDKAEFSERAKLLAKARVSLSEVSDVRSERINEIRQRIENGTYQIPYDGLAKKLMGFFSK